MILKNANQVNAKVKARKKVGKTVSVFSTEQLQEYVS